MSLNSIELDKIRYHMRIALTRIGAEPYIEWTAVLTKAVAPYLVDYGSTSTTAVTAAPSGAIVSITVAANPIVPDPYNAPGFVPGANVVVDLGPLQEVATILAVNGLALSMQLTGAHGQGGVQYPVVLQGAEAIIRQILLRLDNLEAQLTTQAPLTAGITAVDEVRLTEGSGRDRVRNRVDDLLHQREQARMDLGYALGLGDYFLRKGGGSKRGVSLY